MKVIIIITNETIVHDILSLDLNEAKEYISSWIENSSAKRSVLGGTSFWQRYLPGKQPETIITFTYEKCAFVEVRNGRLYAYGCIDEDAARRIAMICGVTDFEMRVNDTHFDVTNKVLNQEIRNVVYFKK